MLCHLLPLDFFGGFFAFFALEDFGVFFSALGVRFAGVTSFFFFLAGYQTTFHSYITACIQIHT